MHIGRLNLMSYEYHEISNAIPMGYIFGLFKLENATLTTIRNSLMDESYEISRECLKEVKHIRIKKNLGS